MAFDELKKAGSPLHVSLLLERIQAEFGVAVDRESLVSSLPKKVARGHRFLRPEKNTFALKQDSRRAARRVARYCRRLGPGVSATANLRSGAYAKRWNRWSARGGAASHESFGPTAARTAVGLEYFLYSRCKREPRQLFQPILKNALDDCPQRLAGV